MANVDKMKEFVKKTVIAGGTFKSLVNWMDSGFDLNAIPNLAVDELVQLMSKSDNKTRMALSDLLRLLVLEAEPQIKYIFSNNWNKLVEDCIIKPIESQDL